MTENELSYKIIGVAVDIHKVLGPGLLESVYETALCHDLHTVGLNVKRQEILPFVYKEAKMETGFKIDILVNNLVIIEIKSVEAQAPVLKDGIHRIVNKL